MSQLRNLIIGVDPGLDGAIAFLNTSGHLSILDMPTRLKKVSGKNRRFIDVERLVERFDRHDLIHVFVEQQSTRSGLAAQSVLKTGTGYGVLLGIIAANYHEHTIITPQKWKKHFDVTRDKKLTQKKATELMPKAAHKWPLVKHDGRAEAALIALYGARELGLEPEEIYA